MKYALLLLACGALTAAAAPNPATNAKLAPEIAGTWALDLEHSDEVPAWKQMELVIATGADGVTITRNLGWGRRKFTASVTVDPGADAATIPLEWWADNRHLGVYVSEDHEQLIEAEVLDEGRTLRTETRFTVETQQRTAPMRITAEYRLWPDGAAAHSHRAALLARHSHHLHLHPQALIRTMPVLHMPFRLRFLFSALAGSICPLLPAIDAAPVPERTVPENAYVYTLGEKFTLPADLPRNAMMISLQGLANTGAPRLYLDYPKDWAWRDLAPLRDFIAKPTASNSNG
ncbi:MAG: GxGYxYP domain-containing protein [Opitutaceae bacterium]